MRHFILAFFALLSVTWPVRAAETLMLKQETASHPEEILMAFHKLSGNTPDFLAWAKVSPFLEKAKDIDRDMIIDRENKRMKQAYDTRDVSQPLVVHTSLGFTNYSTIQETLQLDEFSQHTFFSYAMYGENVAIVPRGIEKFNKIPVPKADMDAMLAKGANAGVMAELILVPVIADGRNPFVMNKISYSLLLAEIKEIRFWGNEGTGEGLLWTWRAPDYNPGASEKLLSLKPDIAKP